MAVRTVMALTALVGTEGVKPEWVGHRSSRHRVGVALVQTRSLPIATSGQLFGVGRRRERQLLRGEHRWPIRRHPLAVPGVRTARWPLLDRREDLEYLGP